MPVATVWNFKTWADTWQRRMKHTVTLHTLEKRGGSYCGIPSQSTSRPILTWYLWCGTGASVDITFKMLKVMRVTSWHLKHVEEVERGIKLNVPDPRTVWNGFPRRELFETAWNYSKLGWHYLRQAPRTVRNGSSDLMFRNRFFNHVVITRLIACNFHLKPCYLKTHWYFVVNYIRQYMINHSCRVTMCVICMSMYVL